MSARKSRPKRSSKQDLLVEALTAAGWKRTRKGQLFDKADLEYANNQMHLEVEYGDRHDSLYLTLADRTGKEIALVIRFEKKLEDTIRTITDFQDKITPSNFREHVRSIVRMGVPVFVDTGEELVPVVDDEGGETEEQGSR
jgi:hypothetical protein